MGIGLSNETIQGKLPLWSRYIRLCVSRDQKRHAMRLFFVRTQGDRDDDDYDCARPD